MTNGLENEIQKYSIAAHELRRLMQLRDVKSRARDVAKAEADSLRAGVGARLLAAVLADDPTGEGVAIGEATEAAVRAESLAALVTALDERISDQQTAVHKAHAGAIRADAARMRAEAVVLQQPIDALLLQLRELAGCEFEPKRNRPPMVIPGTIGGAPMLVTQTRTRVEELNDQAAHFDRAADAIEAGRAIETSFIDGKPYANLPDYLELASVPAKEQ